MCTVTNKAPQSLLSDEEYKTLNDFLTLMDVWGEDYISTEILALAEKRRKPEPRIFKWTEEDLNLLREQYPLVGSKIPELRKKFTTKQINNRAVNLQLVKHDNHVGKNNWNAYQESLLRERYPYVGYNIPELLQVFSIGQIRNKAHYLGLKSYNVWTSFERNLLIKEYPTKGYNIPELLDRFPKTSIINKAGRLGLKRRKPLLWTPKMVELLKAKYSELGSDIPELLVTLTKDQIRGKASSLGLKRVDSTTPIRFTKDEIAILYKDYPIWGPNIPQLLQRHSSASISAKAYSLGLHMIDRKQSSYK